MYRLFLHWLPSLFRQACLLAPVCVLPALILSLAGGASPLWILPAALLLLALLLGRYWFHLWRFARITRRFQTVRGEHVVLRHAAELAGVIEAASFLQRCEQTLAEFSRRFGFTLKRRLVIFLFPTASGVSRFFKTQVGGCAFVHGDAVVLTNCKVGGTPEEVLRHELAHLFSARWSKLDPPLKGEGLATWFMDTLDGKPIDFHALAALLTDHYLFLTWLTDRAWFYGSASSYLVAGSFTGDLIRRFGWDAYRDFFKRARTKNFEACFARAFGISLLAAERQWRDDLLQRRPAFEPELSRLIGERRVEAAYSAGHVYRCLEEAEDLSNTGAAGGKVLWYAAATHAYLGHYEQAVLLLERALGSDDLWVRSRCGDAWVQLGNLYDLIGRRDQAVPAYQHALQEADEWNPSSSSTHTLARLYLSRPFTEDDIQNMLRRQTQHDRPWRKRQRR
jgi:tetratricopeptide (TPR) repeat protein